jgi:hypothetical protein
VTGASNAHRRVRRACAIVPLALAASCSVWRPQPGVGFARPETERVGHARALLRDDTVLDLEDASISADSIVGLGGATHTRFSLPRNDVASVEVQRTEGTLTFLASVLATLLLFAVADGG